MRFALVLALLLLLAACGQKGPLFLPDDEAAAVPAAETAPASDDVDEDEDDGHGR